MHGLVERELELTHEYLLRRALTEDWVTRRCLANEVGGDLIGNACWHTVDFDVT